MNDLLKRTLFGALFLVVMVFCLIWGRESFGILFLAIMYLALKEFYNFTLPGSFGMQKVLAILAAVIAFFATMYHFCYGGSLDWLALALIPLLLIPASCFLLPSYDNFNDVSLIYTGLGYIALPVIFAPILVMGGAIYDGWLLLSLFILVWMNDVGAYCLGTAFGQKPTSKKLAPEISPKKSWWGFWGGVAICVATAVGLYFLGWLPFGIWHCLVLGLIVGLACPVGDLFESLWKRHYHVKDSGNAIPGHGGILDRFDSSLIAIPLAAVYLALFGLI